MFDNEGDRLPIRSNSLCRASPYSITRRLFAGVLMSPSPPMHRPLAELSDGRLGGVPVSPAGQSSHIALGVA